MISPSENMNIQVEKTLEEDVKKYKEKRKYTTDTRAANELIRLGLEKEASKCPSLPTA